MTKPSEQEPTEPCRHPRSPLRPLEFAVDCPACERTMVLDACEWDQEPSGTFAAHGPERWPVCEYCQTQFEVEAVQVVPVSAEPEVTRLRDAHAQLDAWAQSEIGRLKAIIRVNGLRQGATDAEIDEVIHGKR
jgi:hypothetical protein